jgi:hypothetical protein
VAFSLFGPHNPERPVIYSTSVTINAAPETIWSLLTDAAKWPEWEPNCTGIDGQIAVGEKLTVHTKLSDRAFPAQVTSMEANKSMVWSWAMPLGMFKGERTFRLSPKGEGVTEVYCGEEFSGWMLFLFGRTVPDLSDAFTQFGEGLKARAEA